jgi:glycosyltransferase involved in cell wall biosynthesis
MTQRSGSELEAARFRRDPELRPRRILYLTHVDWNWIKQRPQFLAEGLAERHDVDVVYPVSWRRSFLVRNATAVPLHPLLRLPFRRFLPIGALDEARQRAFVRGRVRQLRPDVVWVTFPTLARLIPCDLPDATRIVYDCMDDAPSFAAAGRDEVLHWEQHLFRRAALVLASSDNLAAKLASRGCFRGKLEVVRNAFGGEIAQPPLSVRMRRADEPFRIGYLGTVSSWIDFDVVAECARRIPGVEFHFVGPEETPSPRLPGLHFHGPVDHARLREAVEHCDCLIVPFKRIPLIESVDPVKLYDYINLGKHIVCRAYDEVMRFGEFVHFYDGPDDLVGLVTRLRSGENLKYSLSARLAFLRENRWANRVAQIERALANL